MPNFLESDQNFPRELDPSELQLLFSILPQNKSGYKLYRDKIKLMSVIGHGRFKRGNFILGSRSDKPDFTLPSSPIFAAGTLQLKSSRVYVVIHEEEEDKIEYEITIEDGEFIEAELKDAEVTSISNWIPGMNSPIDNNPVREINLIHDSLVIVVASSIKRIWLHDLISGVNLFIPVTNFYNELMRIRRNRDPKTALNPDILFSNLNNFTDNELTFAFLEYNKIFKKFDINYSKYKLEIPDKKKTGFFNFLKRK